MSASISLATGPDPRASRPVAHRDGTQAGSPSDWLRARAHKLRPAHLALILLGLVLFLAISVLLARFLSAENAERDEVLAVLVAQAAGNPDAMLHRLHGCVARPSCLATVRADALRLRRPGPVKILSLSSKTAYSFTAASGSTRVAWTVIGRLPVVQCVQVERSGDFLSGVSVRLSAISAPIPNEADC